MKLLFAHDHVFCKFEELIFSDKLPYEIWLRYLEYFESLTVFSRYRTDCNASIQSSLSSGENLNFISAENISQLKSYFGLRAKEFARLEKAIGASDAVIARLPSEYGLAAVHLAKRLGKPVMVEVVSCAWDSLWNNGSLKAKLYAPYLFWKMKSAVNCADFALYVSNDYLQNRYPSIGKSVGVSDVALAEFSETVLHGRLLKYAGHSKNFKIGLIGSFKTRYKGIDIAIKAIASLKQTDLNITLHILGAGDAAPYQSLANSLGVQDCVFFEGTRAPGEQIFNWLDDKDLYIQPSLVEGMPRAVLEAMSRGLPVVASAVGGIPEIIDDSCLVAPKDSKGLANKIEAFCSCRDLCADQAKKNFKKSKEYSQTLLDGKRRKFFSEFSDAAKKVSLAKGFKMDTIVFVVNNPAYFVSHRLPIALALIPEGNEVHVIAPGECPVELSDVGFKYHSVEMSRKGMNLFAELSSVLALRRLFKQIQPGLVHLVTIKPYLYGGIAARLAGVPAVVSAVAGLGILFSGQGFKNKVLRSILYPLYHFAFGHKNQAAIFQNPNDKDLLVDWGVLDANKARLIRGAGADLSIYPYFSEPEGVPIISFAARLLKDKGVVEFVEASRLLKQRGVEARFWLIGDPDPGNSNTVTQAQLDEWQQAGLVECLGYRTDIANLFSQSNVVTLPSYYGEGLPKVLIEAAACGRAVITTDHPGCRDAIEADLTGLLVPVRDAVALADAIQDLIENSDKRKAMGKAGRELAEKEFAIEKVVDAHLQIYNELLAKVNK